jgi:hypothetical protein
MLESNGLRSVMLCILLVMSCYVYSSVQTTDAATTNPASAFCHETDGAFTVCPHGNIEWSDVKPVNFSQTNTLLYADQADLLGIDEANNTKDTLMLMYDECGRTVPLGPDEYVVVRFMTVDDDNGLERLEQYVLHIFRDGTIVFIEDGEIEGSGRSKTIEGQRGTVGFGSSPNCSFDHVLTEFQVVLTPKGGAYSPDPLWWTSAVPDPTCAVDITGDLPTMYPGQRARLNAVVSGAVPLAYSWAAEGNIVKDYDDSVYAATVTSMVMPPTPMAPSDFQNPSISFYWKPETDPVRTVAVRVQTAEGICQDSEDYTVAKGSNINTQAEDFYVAANHPIGGTTSVLQQHSQWHNDYPFSSATYNDNGDLFFDFHELYLAHFDAWRTEFGYPPISLWSPGTPLPTGVDVDHVNRASSYTPFPLPSWFQNWPGPANGPANRPSNGNPCEIGDAPGSPWPTTQDELSDYPPDQELLGCALTSPYHNNRHTTIAGPAGDMRFTDRAPLDPIFWRFHQSIDSVSDARDGLTPPRVIYQYPFRLYPYITELPTITDQGGNLSRQAISVYFSEPVSGVNASNFRVNNASATHVTGQGAGPYVFTGFKPPELGSLNIALMPGSILDTTGNRFVGDSWRYILIDPTKDSDGDGENDGQEVNIFRTNPTSPDSDSDGIPDGFESSSTCLNPLIDDTHVMDIEGNVTGAIPDSDSDGISNVEEYKLKTDPCPQSQSAVVQGDFDADGISNDLDNCRLVANIDQRDKNFNGIGDTCEVANFNHGTSAFIQALGNGSTTVEPRSVASSNDPTVQEIVTRIVDFRLNSGMVNSSSSLTENLIDSLVVAGIVSPNDAGVLSKEIIESLN